MTNVGGLGSGGSGAGGGVGGGGGWQQAAAFAGRCRDRFGDGPKQQAPDGRKFGNWPRGGEKVQEKSGSRLPVRSVPAARKVELLEVRSAASPGVALASECQAGPEDG